MLAYNMAKNKYMPHLFMEKGDRLGYSNGILTPGIWGYDSSSHF